MQYKRQKTTFKLSISTFSYAAEDAARLRGRVAELTSELERLRLTQTSEAGRSKEKGSELKARLEQVQVEKGKVEEVNRELRRRIDELQDRSFFPLPN